MTPAAPGVTFTPSFLIWQPNSPLSQTVKVTAPATTGTIAVTYSISGTDVLGTIVPPPSTLTVSALEGSTTVTAADAIYDGLPHGGAATVAFTDGSSQSLAVGYAGRNATV